jgi:hypothetical protein
MTSRERLLNAINFNPVDRIPVWPKIWTEYPGFQKGAWKNLDLMTFHLKLRSDFVDMAEGDDCLELIEGNNSHRIERTPDRIIKTITTSIGKVTSIIGLDISTNSWHPIKYPLSDKEDIITYTSYLEDLDFEVNVERLKKYKERIRNIGDNGISCVCCGTSALMNFVENWAGPENAHFFLLDHEKEVEALFEAAHSSLEKRVRKIAEFNPADFCFFNENTSTTLISPTQYNRYCFPHLNRYSEILRTYNRGKFLHMCGHLKDLLPQLAELDFHAFEAFTSPPVGNCTLPEGREALPKIALIGGSNAVDWANGADAVISAFDKQLFDLPNHRGIILSSGGAMPPQVKPETLQKVVEWVQSVNPKN